METGGRPSFLAQSVAEHDGRVQFLRDLKGWTIPHLRELARGTTVYRILREEGLVEEEE